MKRLLPLDASLLLLAPPRLFQANSPLGQTLV